MEIRKAKEKDTERISYLINKSIDNILDKSYTKEQIAIWKKINTPSTIQANLSERIIFCGFENDKLVGTIGLKANEIVGLYISYSKTNKGIGGKLLRYVEDYAKEIGLKELKITSIPSAESFYLRKGYKVKKQVITDVEGVKFDEKELLKTL